MLPEANRSAARAIVATLAAAGVRHACISPGSRSTPLALAFSDAGRIRKWVITDERSAAFFALGIALESREPVALLCTSGTAAANYLPAIVEADLSGVPLVVLTADRPPELRECAAPQTIRQVGLFHNHIRWELDLPAPCGEPDEPRGVSRTTARAVAIAIGTNPGPVHLNVPFREPLLDPEQRAEPILEMERASPLMMASESRPTAASVEMLAESFVTHERGLLLAGVDPLGPAEQRSILGLARALGWPILADPLSGLRTLDRPDDPVIDSYDIILRSAQACDQLSPTAVVQFGRPATSKALFQALQRWQTDPFLLVAPRGDQPDPTHTATHILQANVAALADAWLTRGGDSRSVGTWVARWQGASAAARASMAASIAAEPALCEAGIFARLQEGLERDAVLVVGNSMPIRDADLVLAARLGQLTVRANRGASGIDGVLSTGLGITAVRSQPTALVLGDLSFLHDGGALRVAAREKLSLLIVVIQNDGGGIFSFLPQAHLDERFETYFGTPHGTDLAKISSAADVPHQVAESWADLDAAIAGLRTQVGPRVVEVRTERNENRAWHQAAIDTAVAAGCRTLDR